MKKVCSVSAGLLFLVAVTVFAFAQQGQQGMMEGAHTTGGMTKDKMEEGKSEMKGMMEGAKGMEMKDGMVKEGQSEMKGMMEKQGEIMQGEMKKETTGMMK